jgi:hypothetical protein
MAAWHVVRMTGWSTRAVIAAAVLAAVLVAAVPAAFVVGLILMLLGHVVAGLALFGGAILAAGAAVTVAVMTGMRRLRQELSRYSGRIVQLGRGEYHYS